MGKCVQRILLALSQDASSHFRCSNLLKHLSSRIGYLTPISSLSKIHSTQVCVLSEYPHANQHILFELAWIIVP
jgi:hypothetical protein